MKVPIKKIRIETENINTKRVRKEFSGLVDLSESIKRHGLIHPIVVVETGGTKYTHQLVAGERRLKACIMAGFSDVEVTLKSDLNDVQLKEIELEENLHRSDLSWMEQCFGMKQLDELKRKLYGEATRARGNVGWGIRDTAESLRVSIGTAHGDIQLAKDLEENPELVKMVAHLPKHAARRIVAQEKEAKRLREEIARKNLIIDVSLRHGDCLELVKELDDNSVQCLITDPPFGLADIADQGTRGSKTMFYNIVESNVGKEDEMFQLYKRLFPILFKKLKDGAHLYIFFAMGWYCNLQRLLAAAGFEIGDVPIVWDKMRTSIIGKRRHYTSAHENVLFGHRPPVTRLLKEPLPDVLHVSAIPPQSKVHPLQKPHELLSIFVEQSTNVGELILDPFAGSGQVLVTAKSLQRRAIGFELSEENYLKAQEYIRSKTS